jgi:hypothetical protein
MWFVCGGWWCYPMVVGVDGVVEGGRGGGVEVEAVVVVVG